MTTTVTVKTHDWPVRVTQSTTIDHKTAEVIHQGYQTTDTFVPANVSRDFCLSSGTSLLFRELPQDATGLPDSEDF